MSSSSRRDRSASSAALVHNPRAASRGPARPGKSPGKSPGRSLDKGPDKADERLVDAAIAHLRRVVVGGQVETLIQVGEYLIENFYGGADEARSRSPFKAASLRRLVARAAEFGMTPSTLGYVVPVTLAAREVGATLAGRLGVSRLRVLLPVKNTDQRRLIAQTAVSSGWSVEKLKTRVRKTARAHAGGRPAIPAIERLVGRAARLLDAQTTSAHLREGLDRLAPARARRLLADVNRAQENLERVERLLVRAATRDPGAT